MGGLFRWTREWRKGPQVGGADEVQTRGDTGSPQGLGWEGLDGRTVTVAKCEPKDRAAGAWLVHPLLSLPDLAHRGAQQTFENG